MRRVGLILLAAGASTRLGRPKQLLRLEGRTLLRRAAEAAVASACRPIIVVLGAQAEDMGPELAGLPCRVVNNPDWEQGMASSLHTGLRALEQDNLDGVCVILCDQPLLTTGVIDGLVAAFRENAALLAVSEYGSALGVPAVFGRALFPELLALSGPQGAKAVIRRYAAVAARVPFPGGAVDIDTPEDLDGIAC